LKLRPVAFAPDPIVRRETIVEKHIQQAEPQKEIIIPPAEVTLEMYNNLRASMEKQRKDIDESAHTNVA
jgi:hypothetical protein